MHTEQEEIVGDNLGGMEAVSPTEIAERTSGERGQRGEDEGRGVSFVINETGAWAFRSTNRWKRWAMIGRPCGTSARIWGNSLPLGRGRGFGHEVVMRERRVGVAPCGGVAAVQG